MQLPTPARPPCPTSPHWRQGRYVFKLLAVDVPSAAGGEQRVFLEGGPGVYERGGVLDVLREPFIRALSMSDVWEAEDDAEDRSEATQAAAAVPGGARPVGPEGAGASAQGTYFYERVFFAARRRVSGLLWGR